MFTPMKFLFFVISLILSVNLYSQQFSWGESGYISMSGGGYFPNVDGRGTNLTLSGFINDVTINGSGCIRTGIDNQKKDSMQHTYEFNFSQPVDLSFSMSGINKREVGSCYNDQLIFSGNPIFSNDTNVMISGDTVKPTNSSPIEGVVTVTYKNIQSFTIKHGAGILCNPGHIYICALKFESLTTMIQHLEMKFKVYPNPSNGIVNIEFQNNNSSIREVKVISLPGDIVYSQKVDASSQIDLSHLKHGLYFLSIKENGQTSFSKIQIQ